MSYVQPFSPPQGVYTFPAVDMGKEIYPSFKLQGYFSQSHLISCIVAIPGAQPDCERTGSNSPPSGRMLSSAVYRTGICLFRKVSADMEKECLEHSSEKTCSEKERLIGGKPDYH